VCFFDFMLFAITLWPFPVLAFAPLTSASLISASLHAMGSSCICVLSLRKICLLQAFCAFGELCHLPRSAGSHRCLPELHSRNAKDKGVGECTIQWSVVSTDLL
jgi:hypothetical protein